MPAVAMPEEFDGAVGLLRQALGAYDPKRIDAPGDTRPAAVLVALYPVDGRAHLVFTRRTQSVEYHKGQISFPGGACDPSDRDAVHAALRESREEIGLAPQDVEILGRIDELVTGRSRFRITPVVGAVTRSPYPFVPNPLEVAEIIPVPVAWLADPANAQLCRVRSGDVEYTDRAYQYGPHLIWGATGRIVQNLVDLLRSAS